MFYFSLFFIATAILFQLNYAIATSSSGRKLSDFPALCGGWKALTDKKCIKIFHNLDMMSFERANSTCVEQGGHILRIESEQEQQLLQGYFFNASQPILFDDIWLGMRLVKSNSGGSKRHEHNKTAENQNKDDNKNNQNKQRNDNRNQTQTITSKNETDTITNNQNQTDFKTRSGRKNVAEIKNNNNNNKNADDETYHWAWENGAPLEYTNWVHEKEPATSLGNPSFSKCIELSASSDDQWTGKWTSERCQKHNMVVCEKPPLVDLSELLEIIFEQLANKVHQIDHHKQNKKPSNNSKSSSSSNSPEKLTDLDDDFPSSEEPEPSHLDLLLPVGFIYTQLSQTAAPTELWPSLFWEDISSSYESAFFRALGDQSGLFDEVQPEAMPFIDSVKLQSCPAKGALGHGQQQPNQNRPQNHQHQSHHNKPNQHHHQKPHQSNSNENHSDQSNRCDPSHIQQEISLNATLGGWSEPVLSAGAFNNAGKNRVLQSLVFHVQKTELRPRNVAVRIWKRVG